MDMRTTPIAQDSPVLQTEALASVLMAIEPLVLWCLSAGIGYGQLSRALKHVFFENACKQLDAKGDKVTDSAISLLSGLHKVDVGTFKQIKRLRQTRPHDEQLRKQVLQHSVSISPAQQVLALWRVLKLPSQLPYKSAEVSRPVAGGLGATEPVTEPQIQSFFELVRSAKRTTSQGYSPRLVLQDMKRQGYVSEQDDVVSLCSFDEVQAGQIEQRQKQFFATSHDFLQAGIENLMPGRTPPFLEASLNGDQFSRAAVQELQGMARQWWSQAVQNIGERAVQLNQRDEQQGGDQRLRLGVYFYAEDMLSQTPEPARPATDRAVSHPASPHSSSGHRLSGNP